MEWHQFCRRQTALQRGGRVCVCTPEHQSHGICKDVLRAWPQQVRSTLLTCDEIQRIIFKVLVLITSANLGTS